MSTPSTTHRSAETRDREQVSARDRVRRVSTETKASFKTTEFFAYLAVVIGLLIAGNAVEANEGGADYFAADKVWLYITLLTIGYMVTGPGEGWESRTLRRQPLAGRPPSIGARAQ